MMGRCLFELVVWLKFLAVEVQLQRPALVVIYQQLQFSNIYQGGANSHL